MSCRAATGCEHSALLRQRSARLVELLSSPGSLCGLFSHPESTYPLYCIPDLLLPNQISRHLLSIPCLPRAGQLGDRWILAGVLPTRDLLLPLCRQKSRDRNTLGNSAELSGATSEDLGSGGVPH